MIKTVMIKSFIRNLLKSELSASTSEDVKTDNIPIIPKATDAMTNIRVAIFCIVLVYQTSPMIIFGDEYNLPSSKGGAHLRATQ